MSGLDERWRATVAVALLGTDRKDPPVDAGPIDDLVADAARLSPSQRLLDQVAALTAARRAGVLPNPPVAPTTPPPDDDRPACSAAACAHWRAIVERWPLLEDEWVIGVLATGQRIAAEIAPALLFRHRSHEVRLARAVAAVGPSAQWLHVAFPELAPRWAVHVAGDVIMRLPDLPQPAELVALPATEVVPRLVDALTTGEYGTAHRAVLTNLVARITPTVLGDIERTLGAFVAGDPGYAIAGALADVAALRATALAALTASH